MAGEASPWHKGSAPQGGHGKVDTVTQTGVQSDRGTVGKGEGQRGKEEEVGAGRANAEKELE